MSVRMAQMDTRVQTIGRGSSRADYFKEGGTCRMSGRME